MLLLLKHGCPEELSVMTTVRSYNYGLAVFLTNFEVAEKEKLPEKKLIRTIALTNLITIFKNHVQVYYYFN